MRGRHLLRLKRERLKNQAVIWANAVHMVLSLVAAGVRKTGRVFAVFAFITPKPKMRP
jgi:hypothetical protein